jgi:pimeloyl-ACP methyl ester carboxylesterase
MKPVVFIHGMFMTPLCWDGWVRHFATRGISSQAPAWPLHDDSPAAMRAKHPDPALGKLELSEVVARYEALLQPMAEKPFLVGHSMGGLVVQLLLQKKLGAAGVAIDSAPPKGVLAISWSLIKSNLPVLLGNKNEAFLPTVEQFAYAFAHTLTPDELRAAYDGFVCPESRRVGRATTTDAARVDFAADRPPLLFVAGGLDHIIPAKLNRANHRAYAKSPARTEIHEFPERTHYTLAQKGWEEVADFVIDWLGKQ